MTRARTAGDVVRTFLRGLGQTMITLGVVVLLFCVYELQVTGLVTARAQDQANAQLDRTWSEAPRQVVPGQTTPSPGASPAPASLTPIRGDAFARLHVPALEGYEPKALFEGVSTAVLKKGPGHIPGTALPGEVGNVVLSGHRTTYGSPFNRWAELRVGDEVVLETRDGWFTYRITGSKVVAPTAVEVTYAVPGDRRATPTRRLLTMTTCNPKYSAKERLIVSAELSASSKKSDGLPAALAGRG